MEPTNQSPQSSLAEDIETKKIDPVELQKPQPTAPQKFFTIGEAVDLRKAAAEAPLDEVLTSLLYLTWDNGEANPEFQKYKIWVKELFFRLSDGGGVHLTGEEAAALVSLILD